MMIAMKIDYPIDQVFIGLEDILKEVDELLEGYVQDKQALKWKDRAIKTLSQMLGEHHPYVKEFTAITFITPFMDDMEKAAIQLRTFADKIRNATYGYSGFFDAVKINEEELAKLYAFDSAFFQLGDNINQALDTVENNLGNPDGLPAAIRNLVTMAREATQTYDRRYEVITGSGQ